MNAKLATLIVSGFLTAVGAAAAQSPAPTHVYPHPDPCVVATPCVTKICVIEPAKKKITKTIYDCKCEDFCLTKCTHGMLHRSKHKDCNGCDADCCVQCEKKVRTKKVLYKKVITTECDIVKCVPKEVPHCVPCPEPCCPPACVDTVTLTPDQGHRKH